MPSIRVLDPLLVNQIAAGEVVERPASVVKELMENALDGGAARIDVTLEDGGATLVSVSDDGAGIAPDELPLAVAPHATSKIATLDDLMGVRTLGFRGEALPSIASVSRVRIISRTAERLDAACLDVADGRIGPVQPCAAPPGTTVEVRNLFYNVPARRKFLRTDAAELGHVTEQIARVALARPDVAISQTHQGRVIRRLPAAADRRTRIGDFFGQDLAADLIAFDRREPDLRVEGWFAPPAASRASSKWQYIFLNGRFIRDRDLSGFVIREAFRGLIEPARYPVVFLFLTADPSAYDVNVHPTKIEVRWRDAGRVKSQVLAVLRETLLSRDLTPTLRAYASVAASSSPVGELPVPFTPAQNDPDAYARAFADQLRSMRPASPSSRFGEFVAPETGNREQGTGNREQGIEGTRNQGGRDEGTPARSASEEVSALSPRSVSEGVDTQDSGLRTQHSSAPATLPGRAIQIHNTYLVCETPDGLLIIDQHALHERIIYEDLRLRIGRGPLESQRLLLPESLDAAPEQLAALDAAGGLLARLGFEAAPFGPRSVAVHAAPSLLSDHDVRAFVADLLDRLLEPGRANPDALLDDILSMMACKAAVKAGDRLTGETIEALLARRHLVEKSSNCPHGRPTTLQMTVRDLERQFKRA